MAVGVINVPRPRGRLVRDHRQLPHTPDRMWHHPLDQRRRRIWAATLIPDSRLKCFLRCDLPVQVFVVDLNRDPVTES